MIISFKSFLFMWLTQLQLGWQNFGFHCFFYHLFLVFVSFFTETKLLKRAECVIVDLNPKKQDTSRNNTLLEDIWTSVKGWGMRKSGLVILCLSITIDTYKNVLCLIIRFFADRPDNTTCLTRSITLDESVWLSK